MRYPVVITVQQIELSHAILEVCIKPGRLNKLFEPGSVVVFGASDRQGGWGCSQEQDWLCVRVQAIICNSPGTGGLCFPVRP